MGTKAELSPAKVRRKLEARLRGQVGRAIYDFNMIEDGDRIMVCVSGGKDSYTLLHLLIVLQRSAPIDFELLAVNLDQKQPGYPEDVLPQYFESIGVPFRVVEADTYSTVTRVIPEGKTYCGLCSRLRRAILYRIAKEEGISKLALGHHRDDMVETLFLNMFHRGKLKGMPPKLISDDGHHLILRPLAYASERDIAQFAELMKFPIIPCNLCGSQQNLQRTQIKQMLQQWEKENPGRIEGIFTSMQNVSRSHLSDHQLYDFKGLTIESVSSDLT